MNLYMLTWQEKQTLFVSRKRVSLFLRSKALVRNFICYFYGTRLVWSKTSESEKSVNRIRKLNIYWSQNFQKNTSVIECKIVQYEKILILLHFKSKVKAWLEINIASWLNLVFVKMYSKKATKFWKKCPKIKM